MIYSETLIVGKNCLSKIEMLKFSDPRDYLERYHEVLHEIIDEFASNQHLSTEAVITQEIRRVEK
jgi:hypothetical protein